MEDLGVYGAVGRGQEGNHDPFKRLSDDLIVTHIFDKICEAKSLFSCSLVSKSFSSLVYKTKNVSFKIPLQIPQPKPQPPTTFAAFPGKVVHVVAYPIPFVHDLSSELGRLIPSRTKFDLTMVENVTRFLRKFNSIESLLVELDYSATYYRLSFHKEPAIKWMLDSRSAALILLMAPKSIVEDKTIYPAEIGSHCLVFDCHLAIAFCTCMLMRNLVPSLPESLVQFVITDSKRRGKIEFGESDLFAMRPGNQEQIREEETNLLCKLWKECSLEQLKQLPGFADQAPSAMRIGSFFLGKDRGNIDDDYSRVTKAFQGAQAIYIEAVMEMLKEIRGSF